MGERTTVLVVDDEAGVRRLVAHALRIHLADLDLEMLQADGAEAALQWVDAVRPALVMTDLLMPGAFDGLELVRRLKADPATAALPVVALSATAHHLPAARDAGASPSARFGHIGTGRGSASS